MKKVKRYNENGYVTADDSNSGMAAAYDEGALERANSSEDSQAIANEAKGDAMLKAMRDEPAIAKSKPKAKSFAQRAKDANFTSAETKGGAALMYRKPTRSKTSSAKTSTSPAKKGSGNTVDFGGFGLGMKSGGSASSRADGIATKGKTRGKMC
jgi:hypothetical protein